MFGSNLYPTLWCMNSFFYSSVIVAIIFSGFYQVESGGNRYGKKWSIPVILILGILVSYVSGYVWIGIGCMGGLVYWLNKKVPGLKIIINIICFAVLLFYKLMAWNYDEGDLLFLVQGILCALMFLTILKGEFLKDKLSNKLLAKGGEISFYIYLSHVLVMHTWGYFIAGKLWEIFSFKTVIIITFISTAVVTLTISYLLFIVLEKKMKFILNGFFS